MKKKWRKWQAHKGKWMVKMFNQMTGECKEINQPSAYNLSKEWAQLLVEASTNSNIGTVLVAEKMPKPYRQ